MFYSDNSDKYNDFNPLLLDQSFLEGLENILPEKNDTNDVFLNDHNDNIFFNQENVETDSYILPQINEESISPNNNSSESNKNASTNTSTKSKKEGPLFNISKTPKNTDNTNNTNNTNNSNNENKAILGLKRKRGINFKDGKHDKYSPDNLTRKLKSKLFASILFILNTSIEAIQTIKTVNFFSNKIFYSRPTFLKVVQNIIKNINVDFNKNLLKSKLKDIFSHNISKKYKTYDSDLNKKLIEKIYKENIQTKTISILEKTLLECLDHFRGIKYYPELGGLEKEYNKVISEMKSNGESNEYIDFFQKFLSKFEVYYNSKKAKPKKNYKNKKTKKTKNKNY